MHGHTGLCTASPSEGSKSGCKVILRVLFHKLSRNDSDNLSHETLEDTRHLLVEGHS